MKKITLATLALAMSLSAAATPDITDLLGKIKGSGTSENTEESSSTSKAGDILGGIVGAVQSATATTKFSVDDLVGTWNYSSPAVSLKSDNALKKIGGVAATTALEEKLAGYYKTAGLTSVVLTVDAEHNFTMKLKFATLKGTVEKDGEDLKFNFSALGKVKLGSVSARATKSLDTLNLTFDVSGLISVLQKVSSVANIKSLSTVSDLLSGYDGLYAGFKLKKQK